MTQPDFSIVVPTHNRPRLVAECLQAFGRLEYPRDRFEVLVINDGGDTRLDTVVAFSQSQYTLTLLTQLRRGPAAARNAGAAHARGRFLVFTDDDCEPDPSWLSNLATYFANAPDGLVGGRVINALPRNSYSAASQLLIDYFYSRQTSPLVRTPFFASNNLALPATDFRALSGFDPTFPLPAAEDRDLCDRWRQAGRPLLYGPRAIVYHKHSLTFRGFWQQQVRYGRGAARFHCLRARRASGRIRLEAPTFYLDLLRYPLSHASPGEAIPLLLLFALSQGAVAFGYFSEYRRMRANTSARWPDPTRHKDRPSTAADHV
jgi:GT2 family glycosyltransferase